jgi:hypothetical protein
MDDIERAAIAAEGYNPDDPAVLAAVAAGDPSPNFPNAATNY